MRYVTLGKSGLRVSELCLGTNTFGTEWGFGTDKEGAQAILNAFTGAGGNFIDTASNYNKGTSEKLLGDFLKEKRKDYVLATKWSMATGRGPNEGGNGRKAMVETVENSLRRLKTDYVDLLYMHAWDGVTPEEEVMKALDDLIRAGKILYIGLSDTPAWTAARMDLMAELKGWSRVAALQFEYSLVERTAEEELIPLAHYTQKGVVAWYALGAGVLTGKYNKGEGKGRLKEDSLYRSEQNLNIAKKVVEIAKEIGRSPSQVAINWVRQRGIIPIIGSSKVVQTEENLGCLKFELTSEHVQQLNEISQYRIGFPAKFLKKEGMDQTLKVYDSMVPKLKP